MGRALGIIQPARIGDILLCLPIARHYFEDGRDIHWPAMSYCYEMFAPAVCWVTWHEIPMNFQRAVTASKEVLGSEMDILNLANGFFEEEELTREHSLSGMRFDAFKYARAQVPLEKKWGGVHIEKPKLQIQISNCSRYTLYHPQGSCGFSVRRQCLDVLREYYYGPTIEIRKETGSIFHWMDMLEHAEEIAVIDSCFAILADMIGWRYRRRTLIQDNPDFLTPTFAPAWDIIRTGLAT